MLRSLTTLPVLLLAAAPALAADPVHNVRSDKAPVAVTDHASGNSYGPSDLNDSQALFSWQEGEEAFIHAVAEVNTGDEIEFRLVKVTSSTQDEIDGLFDIYVNGSLKCDDCIGEAYGLDQAAGTGNYFKIYVGTASAMGYDWLFAADITSRDDY